MLRPDNLDTAGRKNTEVVALAVEVTAEMTEFLHRVVATEGATVVVRDRKATVAVVAMVVATRAVTRVATRVAATRAEAMAEEAETLRDVMRRSAA